MSPATPAAPDKIVTGFADSTSLLGSPERLRARADEEGFLFFKQLLPKELLLELRRQVLGIVARHGWLRPGTDVMDGIADPDAIAASDARDESLKYIGVTRDAYREIQGLELFHTIPHHPRLIALYEALFEAPVLPHPRHIARVLLPAPSSAPTPPHQDYIYIQGTHRFWTLWFPLGDCPIELGGLSVLRGSHREEVLDVTGAAGAGGKEAILCGKDYSWVQDDYECGDVLTFPSHMVHKGLPNRKRERVRLSLDLRYQSADDEIEEKSLVPHMDVAAWEEIYAGWKNDRLKYYWKSRDLRLSPWDASLMQNKEKIC
ncbi:MAG: phytanoyl-CoA dioxygenase family protein [Terrimicrobiaceae bacterium]